MAPRRSPDGLSAAPCQVTALVPTRRSSLRCRTSAGTRSCPSPAAVRDGHIAPTEPVGQAPFFRRVEQARLPLIRQAPCEPPSASPWRPTTPSRAPSASRIRPHPRRARRSLRAPCRSSPRRFVSRQPASLYTLPSARCPCPCTRRPSPRASRSPHSGTTPRRSADSRPERGARALQELRGHVLGHLPRHVRVHACEARLQQEGDILFELRPHTQISASAPVVPKAVARAASKTTHDHRTYAAAVRPRVSEHHSLSRTSPSLPALLAAVLTVLLFAVLQRVKNKLTGEHDDEKHAHHAGGKPANGTASPGASAPATPTTKTPALPTAKSGKKDAKLEKA